MKIKKDMAVSIAHAGLDIIRSKDQLYKDEMERLGINEPKNNGQSSVVEDPLLVLKQMFKPKEFGPKILDKNHIANKYR